MNTVGEIAMQLFFLPSGRCPLFSQSSGAYNSLQEVVKFNLGVAQLPLDKQVTLKRQANLIGGAAIWSVANQTPTVYRGIALFLNIWPK